MTWKPFTYEWKWQLTSTPAELWPYVADTQRFNQAVGLPTVKISQEPLETGGSRNIVETGKYGIIVIYEDYPFEWIKEQEFRNLRLYKQGPIAQTFIRLTLTPTLPSGTLLTYFIEAIPANLMGLVIIPYLFGRTMYHNSERIFQQIDQAIQNRQKVTFLLPVTPLSPLAKTRLTQFSQQLIAQGHQKLWVENLAETITGAADVDLSRMRPYQLADQWQAPHLPVLELFLSAAKLGLLNTRWDLICPQCHGPSLSTPSLDGVRKGVHCSACNIDYETNFSENVELTFTPHPQIRTVEDTTYCLGGPMLTPHILFHQTIQPGEERIIRSATRLPPGTYLLRTQKPGVETHLTVSNDEANRLSDINITATAETIQVKTTSLPAGKTSGNSALPVTYNNQANYPQRVYLQQSGLHSDVVTAAYVTSLQHFRDLFSDAVLRPGEEIGIQSMTIMFSDLVGSTAMYNRRGDAPSYALVREQFSFLGRIVREYQGGIVKTIGDAIMATFTEPANGVGAALAIQQQIETFNAANNDKLTIKLGVHYGPCIAVNLNGRLDYFGTTVNLAARLEGQSKGDDVVISEKLRQEPGVDDVLQKTAVEITRFETVIKGFNEHFWLYRLSPSKK